MRSAKDKRKPETIMAEMRRTERDLRERLNRSIAEAGASRARATKAEQEASEWRGRFDRLLARVPMAPITDAAPE